MLNIYIIQQQGKMFSIVFKLCEKCCPWLKKENRLEEFKKIHETEGESFMKAEQETLNDPDQQHKKQQTSSLSKMVHQQLQMQDQKIQNIEDLLHAQLNSNKQHLIWKQHPYHDILSEKLTLLPGIFDLGVEPEPKVAQTPYKLKIYIKQSQDEKRNIFVYNFTFPTSYDFYEDMQNNFKLQKSFDTNIEHYDCKQIIDENTKIIYLAYKKMLIVQPRDFVYVRYTFRESESVYWSVATSIPNEQIYQGTVRGTIVLTATRIIQDQNQIHISVYSQVDMKMGIKQTVAKTRGITEIKKYLDRCYEYIQKEKNNIL